MSRAQLIASRALWRRRLLYRQRKVDIVRGQAKDGSGVVTHEEAAQIKKWERLRDEAKRMVERRDEQLGSSKPRIITAASLGLTFQYVFGMKGTIYRGAGHYTAGHRASNATELAAEMRADHAFHKSKGWGGLSYEAMVADDGTIGLGNPVDRKGAAVAGQNTGLVNICCPGTTGDRMTAAQKRSVEWLLKNWHTSAVPKAHRLPRPASGLMWKVHRDWPGQSTACPGDMKADYLAVWR